MGFASNSGVRYFGVFIAAAGVNANVPASMAYQFNNVRGQWALNSPIDHKIEQKKTRKSTGLYSDANNHLIQITGYALLIHFLILYQLLCSLIVMAEYQTSGEQPL